MEKPHIPTIAELEALFGDDTTPLYVYPTKPEERLKMAAITFLALWDEGLTILELSPFVEELRKAIEGRP